MFPPRGPVQAYSSGGPSSPPDLMPEQVATKMTQVKILRRPTSAANVAVYNGACDTSPSIKQLPEKTTSTTSGSIIQGSNPLDEEWPSLADASKSLVRSQQKDKSRPPIKSGNGSDAIGSTAVGGHQQTKEVRLISQASHPPSTTKVKSYKERADEYAKARMRIFGSASSDEDNCNPSTSHH